MQSSYLQFIFRFVSTGTANKYCPRLDLTLYIREAPLLAAFLRNHIKL